MRVPLLTLVILGWLARWTTAEINAADTIEWISADSEVIAVGKVDKVGKRGAWFDVTLAVSEQLKGAPGANLTFAVWTDAKVETWKGRELLVFLAAGRRYVDRDKAYGNEKRVPRMGWNTDGMYDLAKPEAYTTSFKVLRKRDELLAAVRVAAKSKATKGHRIDAPWDTDAQKALYGGSTVWLQVPVDATLEQLAVGWIASKDLSTREDAVGALAHFKSPANTKLLVAMLGDPDFAEIIESGKPTVRRYLVRKKAHEVLTTWGVAHKTPVIDEPKQP